MKLFLFIFLFIFLYPASLLHLKKNEVVSSREPANADGCLELVNEITGNRLKIPTKEKLEKFFEELTVFNLSPMENIASIERGYITISKNLNSINSFHTIIDEKRNLKAVYAGKELLERKKLNDSTGKILIELGYREERGYLMPPRDITKLYKNIYEKIVSSAKEKGIGIDDVTFPAIRFSRGINSVFVRPGLDPIPNYMDGWVLMTNVEIPAEQWLTMMKEKKMILGAEMFFHDLGHVIDMIERPEYMIAYRKFLQSKEDALKDVSDVTSKRLAALNYGPLVFRGDFDRYLNEFLYLPSDQNILQIKKVIPHLDYFNPKSREYLQNYYLKKSSVKTAKKWIKNRYILFSNHGGGARDWTVNRYLTPQTINDGFTEIINTESSFYKEYAAKGLDQLGITLDNRDKAYRIYEASDLFLRLQYLVDFKEGVEIPIEIKIHLEKMATDRGLDINSFIDKFISIHLAEIEYRIQSSLMYKITPEQIANDMALLYKKEGWKEYQKSLTFKFYSTYPKYSVQWFLAVDIARKIR